MSRDTLEATVAATRPLPAPRTSASELLARLSLHSHAVRLEKARLELRAELGRLPSESETWLEFRARHPRAAEQILGSAAGHHL